MTRAELDETQPDMESGVHLTMLNEERLVAALKELSRRQGGQTYGFSCKKLSETLFQATAVVQLRPGETSVIIGPREASTYEMAVEELMWLVMRERAKE